VTGGSSLAELLTDASTLFDEADAALKAGDLGTYQQKVTAARAKVTEAEELLSGSTTTTQAPRSAPTTTVPTTTIPAPKPTA
jgi:hypothetical protein